MSNKRKQFSKYKKKLRASTSHENSRNRIYRKGKKKFARESVKKLHTGSFLPSERYNEDAFPRLGSYSQAYAQSSYQDNYNRIRRLRMCKNLQRNYTTHRVRGYPQEMGLQTNQVKPLFHDKERMYQDILIQKKKINKLANDNKILKSKLHNIEVEAGKFERIIVNGIKPVPDNQMKHIQNTLNVRLKQQTKNLRSQLRQMKDQLEDFKRTTKYTNIKDLEMQSQVFEGEIIRLKQILDQTIIQKVRKALPKETDTQKEEIIYRQSNIIAVLQSDNKKMIKGVKILDEQLAESQIYFQKNIHLCSVKACSKKDDEIQKVKAINKRLKQKLNRYKILENEGKQSASSINELQNQLKKKNKQYNLLQQEYDELSTSNKSLSNSMVENRKDFENNLIALKQQRDAYKEKYEQVLISLNQAQQFAMDPEQIKKIKEEKQQKASQPQQQQQKESTKKSPKKQNKTTKVDEAEDDQPKKPKTKILNVDKKDVQNIGLVLKFQLLSSYFPLNKTLEIFGKTSQRVNNGNQLSIQQLDDMFKEKPFFIVNDKERLLLSRYLVESNELRFMYLDKNLENDIIMIKSYFKTLLDSYTLYTIEQEETIHTKVHNFITKYQDSMKDDFKCNKKFKKGLVPMEGIEEVLLNLATNEYEPCFYHYIIIKIMAKQVKPKIFQQKDIFDYFTKPFDEVKGDIEAKTKAMELEFNQEEQKPLLLENKSQEEEVEYHDQDIDEQEEAALQE